jgi:hypothetical protein
MSPSGLLIREVLRTQCEGSGQARRHLRSTQLHQIWGGNATPNATLSLSRDSCAAIRLAMHVHDEGAINCALILRLHIPHRRGSEDALAFDLDLDIIAVVYK